MKSVNILMLVGQSPQIITETLFCISKKYKKTNINKLIIITTSKCAEGIRELFLSDIYKNLKEKLFNSNDDVLNPNIHIIKKNDYTPPDIYNSSDNVIASDFINDVVVRHRNKWDKLECIVKV